MLCIYDIFLYTWFHDIGKELYYKNILRNFTFIWMIFRLTKLPRILWVELLYFGDFKDFFFLGIVSRDPQGQKSKTTISHPNKYPSERELNPQTAGVYETTRHTQWLF